MRGPGRRKPWRGPSLSPTTVTKIRIFYPPNDDANRPQAFPESNMG